MGCDVVATTQWAIEVITGFIALFALAVSGLAFYSHRSAAAHRKELERLKGEMVKLINDLSGTKRELEEFKKEFEGKTFLSV